MGAEATHLSILLPCTTVVPMKTFPRRNEKHSRATQTRNRRLFLETLEPRVVLTGQVPEVTIDGLVSWYRAEGNPNDTANGNHGAFVAGATTVAGGRVGQAFDFDANPRRVEIPNDSSLGLQTFTIDAWVNSIFPGSLGDDMGGGIIGKAFGSSLVSVAIMGPGKNGSNFSNGHFTFAVTTTDGIQQFQESFISPNFPINQEGVF